MADRKPLPRMLPKLLAVLLALFLLGAILFAAFQKRIERWEYPQHYPEYVTYYADKYGIDPLILYAFIRTESNFDPMAESDAGARGLMQITEITFDWIKSKIASGEDIAFDDLFDPALNLRFGTYYFAACLERYQGDVATAAAAYHSGWGTVDGLLEQARYTADGKTLHTFPYAQMGRYVRKIEAAYQRYQALYKVQG